MPELKVYLRSLCLQTKKKLMITHIDKAPQVGFTRSPNGKGRTSMEKEDKPSIANSNFYETGLFGRLIKA